MPDGGAGGPARKFSPLVDQEAQATVAVLSVISVVLHRTYMSLSAFSQKWLPCPDSELAPALRP